MIPKNDAEIKFKVNLDSNEANNKLSKFANVGKTAFKGVSIAIGTTATALGGLVMKSVQMQGDLEQQLGGSEAVFEQFAETIQKKGAEAYRVMGLSQNDYLATANKMGSLMQGSGLSVEKSMNLSTQAMQRASDVASVMGIDISAAMESIAGAAKGNFTMMDNLGVAMNDTTLNAYALEKGIGKTTQQMTNAEKVELAMQMFLEKTSKYAGNYAKENETFAGSFTTLKASIENFMSGAGDINSVVDSVMSFVDILVQSIGTMSPKLVEGIVGLINGIVPQLPTLLQKLLPVIISGAIDLIQGLVQALPSLIPVLMNGIVQAFTGIVQILPELIQALLSAAILIIQALAEQMPVLIPQIIDAILQMIPILIDNLPLFIKAGYQLLTGILVGLIQSVPTLLNYIPKIIKSVVGYFKQMPSMMIDIGKNLVQGLWNGIKNVTGWILDKIKGFGKSVLNSIKGIFGIHSPSKEFAWIGKMNMIGLEEGMEDMIPNVNSTIDRAVNLDYDTSGLDYLKNGVLNVSGNLGSVVPAYSNQSNIYVNVSAEMDVNKFGKAFVRDIKTFSGGAKNAYNYGGGK